MTATLTEACDALAATVVTYYQGQGEPIQVYSEVPGSAVSPAIVVEPASGDYHAVFGSSGGATHTLAVHCLVALGDRREAQRKLAQMISVTGSRSIVAAIHSDRTLGGVVQWADPQGYRDYGTREFEGTAFVMATVDVEVLAL